MQRVLFDFDVVSPYAYLAFERLPAALEGLSHHVEYRPLLFAGLLKHWGNTAPVDVAPKKAWLFRQCAWIAERDGVVFRPPTPHPFNPLALLRLVVASVPAGSHPNRRVVELAMRHVWARDGGDPNDPEALRLLADAIAPVRDPASPQVKAELQARTAQAAEAGVFGVPSFRLDDGTLFWGTDSMAMLADAMRRRQAA
ncbi:MAG: DsbA family protein [Burkholderiales bacterium]|nr:DsbA family protein [Burkholderiales bacterium]